MIRILVVDDHPAVRAGLVAVLRSEPGFVPVGAAADVAEAWRLAQRARADVLLLDLHLPGGGNSLVLCRRLKGLEPAPRVLIYSAFAGSELTLAATLAGADGVIDKAAPVLELFESIRVAHRGGRLLERVDPRRLLDAQERLDARDRPLVAMLLDGTPDAEIAATLRLDEPAFATRVGRLLAQLAPPAVRPRA